MSATLRAIEIGGRVLTPTGMRGTVEAIGDDGRADVLYDHVPVWQPRFGSGGDSRTARQVRLALDHLKPIDFGPPRVKPVHPKDWSKPRGKSALDHVDIPILRD